MYVVLRSTHELMYGAIMVLRNVLRGYFSTMCITTLLHRQLICMNMVPTEGVENMNVI